ncbi:MAG: hypothetical protein K6G11_08055 [Lachnospiraceae bacterium]|nr:hypothetical protein [Lachnospiraceae bacterium]
MGRRDDQVRLAQIKELVEQRLFNKASGLLKDVNPKAIKSVADMKNCAITYAKTEQYDDARELYDRLYEKERLRTYLQQLIYICIKQKDFESASQYFVKFNKSSKSQRDNLILHYRIDKAKGSSYDNLISILEDLNSIEYMEEWAYELAKLYQMAGRKEDSKKECEKIVTWFGSGEIVERARVLMAYLEVSNSTEEFHDKDYTIKEEPPNPLDTGTIPPLDPKILKRQRLEEREKKRRLKEDKEAFLIADAEEGYIYDEILDKEVKAYEEARKNGEIPEVLSSKEVVDIPEKTELSSETPIKSENNAGAVPASPDASFASMDTNYDMNQMSAGQMTGGDMMNMQSDSTSDGAMMNQSMGYDMGAGDDYGMSEDGSSFMTEQYGDNSAIQEGYGEGNYEEYNYNNQKILVNPPSDEEDDTFTWDQINGYHQEEQNSQDKGSWHGFDDYEETDWETGGYKEELFTNFDEEVYEEDFQGDGGYNENMQGAVQAGQGDFEYGGQAFDSYNEGYADGSQGTGDYQEDGREVIDYSSDDEDVIGAIVDSVIHQNDIPVASSEVPPVAPAPVASSEVPPVAPVVSKDTAGVASEEDQVKSAAEEKPLPTFTIEQQEKFIRDSQSGTGITQDLSEAISAIIEAEKSGQLEIDTDKLLTDEGKDNLQDVVKPLSDEKMREMTGMKDEIIKTAEATVEKTVEPVVAVESPVAEVAANVEKVTEKAADAVKVAEVKTETTAEAVEIKAETTAEAVGVKAVDTVLAAESPVAEAAANVEKVTEKVADAVKVAEVKTEATAEAADNTSSVATLAAKNVAEAIEKSSPYNDESDDIESEDNSNSSVSEKDSAPEVKDLENVVPEVVEPDVSSAVEAVNNLTIADNTLELAGNVQQVLRQAGIDAGIVSSAEEDMLSDKSEPAKEENTEIPMGMSEISLDEGSGSVSSEEPASEAGAANDAVRELTKEEKEKQEKLDKIMPEPDVPETKQVMPQLKSSTYSKPKIQQTTNARMADTQQIVGTGTNGTLPETELPTTKALHKSIRDMLTLIKGEREPTHYILVGDGDKRVLGITKKIIRIMNEKNFISSTRIAQISSTQLNKLDVSTVKSQLKGACLLVTGASRLMFTTINEIFKIMDEYEGDFVVVLSDEGDALDKFFRITPALAKRFQYVIDITKYGPDEYDM